MKLCNRYQRKHLIFSALLLASLTPVFSQDLPRPEVIRSFGPNGSHWPSLIETPFMYDDTILHRIIVDADWGDIEAAIEALSAAQVNEGVLILVKPGILEGDGTGSNSDSSLDGLGSTSWSKRVTICPRDGYGSVQMNRAKITYCNNLCIAGFECSGGMRFQGNDQSALAWMKIETAWLGTYGAEGVVSNAVEFVEVVVQNHKGSNGDTSQVSASNGEVSEWVWEGCYFAPVYIPLPKEGSPHSDTLQFFNNGNGVYEDITFKDSVFIASDNTAIQTGLVDGMIFDHTLLVAGSQVYDYHPLPANAENDATKTLNGSGNDFQAIDSIIIGTMGLNDDAGSSRIFTSVENSQVSYSPSGLLEPVSGDWTVNSSLTQQDLEDFTPFPSDTYLSAIWAGNGEIIIPELDEEPPSVPEGLQGTALSSTSVELTWTGSTDNQSVLGYVISDGGDVLQSVLGTAATVIGLNPSTSYDFSVYAYDRSGNQSEMSDSISLTTLDIEPIQDPNDFLAYHWPFDNDQGATVVDIVTNTIGSLSGSAILQNGGVKFSTDNDRIDVPSIDITGNKITLSCWVELDTFENANESRFISKAISTEAEDHYWMLGNYGDGSNVRFRLQVNGITHSLITEESMLSLNVRQNIIAVYDGDAMRIFVDGVLVSEQQVLGGGNISTNAEASVGIGNQPTGAGNRAMRGYIDDVRIYSYAAPAEAIPLIMTDLSVVESFSEWLDENGLSEEQATGDLDNDGIPLLLEYAFETDPFTSSVMPLTIVQNETGYIVDFPRNRTDLDYLIEVSTDLETWGTGYVNQETGAIDANLNQLFYRVKVSEKSD